MEIPTKINEKVVKQAFGMDEHFEAVTEDDYKELLDKWKVLIVRAREEGNAAAETLLNACKAWVLQEMKSGQANACPKCGNLKRRDASYCGPCGKLVRFGVGAMGTDQGSKIMSMDTIIISLKTELNAAEQAAAEAITRRNKIQAAIDALQSGGQISSSGFEVKREAPSVTEMVHEGAKRLVSNTPDAIFDARSLRDAAAELYPQHYSLLKRGVYNALNTLKKSGKIVLAPGGFKLAA